MHSPSRNCTPGNCSDTIFFIIGCGAFSSWKLLWIVCCCSFSGRVFVVAAGDLVFLRRCRHLNGLTESVGQVFIWKSLLPHQEIHFKSCSEFALSLLCGLEWLFDKFERLLRLLRFLIMLGGSLQSCEVGRLQCSLSSSTGNTSNTMSMKHVDLKLLIKLRTVSLTTPSSSNGQYWSSV